MQREEYSDEMQFMLDVINEAAEKAKILTDSGKRIEKKSSYDLVTSVDQNVESFLIGEIRKKYPSDSILSEEFNSRTVVQKRTWTIDPIDGTCNLANSIPQYSIQMSFVADGVITCSAIRTCTGDLFYAQKGNGAYCNGTRTVSMPRELSMSIASFGDFPHSSREASDMTLRAVAALKDKIMKIRFFGAASLDYGYLASGRTDMVVMYTRNAWDIYPGILLCREAGCTVCGMDGQPYNPSSPGVIATNNEELLELVLNS